MASPLLQSLLLAAQIAVISHRGEHLKHPENTLPAFQAAIDAGADYFELDVRTTSDGHLILMHDRTVDRTSGGKGAVREMTFEQIRALNVPTLDEALNLAHGHIGVYVDCKDIAPADLVTALEKAGMLDKVVIYGGAEFLKNVQAIQPTLKVMPEANNAASLEKLLTALKLRVVAFDAHDFTDEVIRIAKHANLEIFVDRLGPADNAAHWQDAIDRGATGIQTDHPAELVEYLRAHQLHK
ncbi:MAG TPA: glycerophosphodiester phosphodiesterase family protein [Bryobacteraceae bacterium]|nr:glycerophosphodiester phosphodiesterase family protein [Bryobacteraceae bacterium]